MVSRHSVFYSPLICTLAAGFLESEGLGGTYDVLRQGQRSYQLLRERAVDVMQTAVSSNWKLMEQGIPDLPAHFAQINQRDGFFLVGRHADPDFHWRKLEGKALLADHGRQPLVMLRYAVESNGAEWSRVQRIGAGTVEAIEAAFRAGEGDFVHLQAPAAQQLQHDEAGFVLASVGEAMPSVAFSSLAASRAFLETAEARAFTRAYGRAREWARQAPAEEVAAREADYFPGIGVTVLAESIRRYQAMGTWGGGLAITRDLYEQALNVFEAAGELARRPPYDDVVAVPPA